MFLKPYRSFFIKTKPTRLTKPCRLKINLADMPALGIAVESPQPDEGGARTCSVKPAPFSLGGVEGWGNAKK